MAGKIIRIRYSEAETGPAELLGGKLARIADPVLLDPELWENDIVLLTHVHNAHWDLPEIAEVVHRQYPCKSFIGFDDLTEALLLCGIFALLGGKGFVLVPPTEGPRGLLVALHHEQVDATAVAEAIGIRQDTERCCACGEVIDPNEMAMDEQTDE